MKLFTTEELYRIIHNMAVDNNIFISVEPEPANYELYFIWRIREYEYNKFCHPKWSCIYDVVSDIRYDTYEDALIGAIGYFMQHAKKCGVNDQYYTLK